MNWSKVQTLLTVFNASSVASDILVKLLVETSLSSPTNYKLNIKGWYQELNKFLKHNVRWHDLCPRLEMKDGVLVDTMRTKEYEATSKKDLMKLVRTKLKELRLEQLSKNQLLKRYQYFRNSSTGKDLKRANDILLELRKRYKILGVKDLTYRLSDEAQFLLKSMTLEVQANYLEKRIRKSFQSYALLTKRLFPTTKLIKCSKIYLPEKYVRPKTEEEMELLYKDMRTGMWIPALEENRKLVESKEENGNRIHPLVEYENPEENQKEIFNSNQNKSGVYLWRNRKSQKEYVGSSENLRNRFYQYLNPNQLERNWNMEICQALLDDGYSAFTLSILEYCDPADCLERENHYISEMNPSYNIQGRALRRTEYNIIEEEKKKDANKKDI